MVMFSPYCFAVHPSVPVNTFAELIAYDKANPGKLNVGNSGVGSIQHLLAIVIAKKYGLKWGMVPYRGGAPAIRAVVSNESNVIFNGALATQPFVVQNQLKGIAVSGDKRLPGAAEPADLQGARHADRRGRLLAGLPRQQGHAAGDGGAAQRRDQENSRHARHRARRSPISAATCAPIDAGPSSAPGSPRRSTTGARW